LKSELVLSPIWKKLQKQAADWHPDTYRSPYTSLIGPTMSGKTRLLLELSNHVCVVYISLRNRDSTDQPTQSALASAMSPTTVPHFSHYHESFLISKFKRGQVL
jgi:hypothetical protein